MTSEQIISNRLTYQAEIRNVTEKYEMQFGKDFKEWVKHNAPFKVGKVVEVINNGIKRRGLKRFVIYTYEPQFTRFSKGLSMFVSACGWWLDENNTPAKWDTMVISGASNNAEFKLSDSQANNPVPKHIADKINQ